VQWIELRNSLKGPGLQNAFEEGVDMDFAVMLMDGVRFYANFGSG
jgi:hypothetical protein